MALAEVVTIGKNCLAGYVLLLACAALTACDTTTPEEHFASARNYYAAGEIRTAVIELKNALQKAPDLAEARYLLGESHARLGDYPSALKEFERALDLGLADEALRVGLLNSKNRLGRYQVGIGQCQSKRRSQGSGLFQLANDLLIAAETVLAVDQPQPKCLIGKAEVERAFEFFEGAGIIAETCMGLAEKAPGFCQIGRLLQGIFQLNDGRTNLAGGVVVAGAVEVLIRRRRVTGRKSCAGQKQQAPRPAAFAFYYQICHCVRHCQSSVLRCISTEF